MGMSARSLRCHQRMHTQGKGSSHRVSAGSDVGSMNDTEGVASALGVDTLAGK